MAGQGFRELSSDILGVDKGRQDGVSVNVSTSSSSVDIPECRCSGRDQTIKSHGCSEVGLT